MKGCLLGMTEPSHSHCSCRCLHKTRTRPSQRDQATFQQAALNRLSELETTESDSPSSMEAKAGTEAEATEECCSVA